MIIYVATNTVNGKQYVGQTVSLLNIRKSQHIHQAKYRSYKSVFHLALVKYGPEALRWDVVEDCTTMEDLNVAEQTWIAKLNTLAPNGYNLETGGKNYEVVEESKQKMRESRARYLSDPEVRKQIGEIRKGKKSFVHSTNVTGTGNPFYGRKHSEETKKKMSKAQKGRKHTEQTKQKLSVLKKGNKHCVGRVVSEETRKKQSETMKKVSARKRAKFNKALGLGDIS